MYINIIDSDSVLSLWEEIARCVPPNRENYSVDLLQEISICITDVCILHIKMTANNHLDSPVHNLQNYNYV